MANALVAAPRSGAGEDAFGCSGVHEQLSLLMMRAAMEHHSRQIKATVGVQTVAVPEFFQMSEEGSDGVQDGEAVGMDVHVVSLERISERSAVSGLQRHSPNIEHAPSLDVPMLQVCRDGGPDAGLQGFLPGQDSTALCRDGDAGLQGFLPGQDSTAFCRDGDAGLQGFLPGQDSTAFCRDGDAGLQGFLPGQDSTAFCRDGGGGIHGFPPEQDSTAFRRDGGGGLHRFPLGQDSTSFCRDGGGGFHDFPPGQDSTSFCEMEDLVEVVKIFSQFRVPKRYSKVEGLVDVLEALSPGQSSTASPCGATPVEQVADMSLGVFQDSIPQRAVLRAPQVAEQLVEVPVLVPSFDHWLRWEEAYRATGHTWLGGFEWSLFPHKESTASPGRYMNTGQDSRRRPWYRTAAVPAVQGVLSVLRQSGGRSRFRLVPTVQTVQRIGGAG